MKIAISAESTIDLPKELLAQYDIHVVPFKVLLGEKDGLDGEITPAEIFNFVELNNVLPKTGAVNEFMFEEHFNELKKNYDAIIHLSLSSEMSSAFNNANSVASKMNNVFAIDTRSLSTGIALLAIYARKLANDNVEPKDIVDKIKARIPYVQASFVLNTLEYLYKGGRCSSLAFFGANLLKLKPQIIVKNGKMESHNKYRGKNDIVVGNYCQDTLKEFSKPDLSVAFVTDSNASQDMIDAATNALKEKGFKQIYHTVAGATISSHCGPKCLGILYINDGNK